MYTPKHHEETDRAVLHDLIRAYPLGTWVALCDDELVVNHVPFLLQPDRGPHGTLVCHVARANPVWQRFSKERSSIVSFQGADGYITPSWYPTKQAHGKAVPTWNYAVVHAHGVPHAIEDRAWLLSHVTQLTATHESGEPVPWKPSDAPAEYIDRMLEMIVGIEIPIDTLAGKWKVSQNRPHADKVGVVAGLEARGKIQDPAMATLVSRFASPRDAG
jgi:transcriptional regulator